MEFWEEILETPPNRGKNAATKVKNIKNKKIKKRRNQFPALCLLIFLLAGIYVYLQWPRYEMVTLGSLDGPFGTAEAINSNGQIAGWSQLKNGESHAFIWDANSGMKDLGTLGGKNSFASSLNDKGQVVGYSENSSGFRQAFIWNSDIGMSEIALPQAERSEASAINNRGQVVGFYTIENHEHAFIWDSESGFKELASPYGQSCSAKNINDNGQVVGNFFAPNAKDHAFYWDKESGMIDIVEPNGPGSYATGINNNGQVVGNIFEHKINNYSGFVWEKESGLRDLKISKIESYANKINDANQIIGYVKAAKFWFITKRSFAFVRTNFGLIVNLNKSGKLKNDIVKAEAINNNGWIAGQIESNALNPRYQPILLKPKKSPITDLLEKIPWEYIKNRKSLKT